MTSDTIRFLHVADVHLGFDRYDNPTRSLDFFHTFYDVLKRYAVQPQVDFVVIAGDLFEHRQILPNVLNQAQIALEQLRKARIPVLAIEGNHDNRPYGVKTSWLRYLADYGYLHLLEPVEEDGGGICLDPWSETQKRGSYLDLPCGVRVIGSQWYGSLAPQAVPKLAQAIQQLPPGPDRTLALFHHGLDGQIARYQGALRYSDLLPLKEAGVGYLALGHIHKNYSAEGWVFNPGSLEANSMAEFDYERGAYAVTWSQNGIKAQLMTNYRQRPCLRLQLQVRGHDTPDQVLQQIWDTVTAANASPERQLDPDLPPLVEFKLSGQIAFARHELDQRQIQNRIQELTQALLVRFRLDATSLEYDLAPQMGDQTPRPEIESQVFQDLLAAHSLYQQRGSELAQLMMEVKAKVLDQCPESELYTRLSQAFLAETQAILTEENPTSKSQVSPS